MAASATHDAIRAVWKSEAPRVVAVLTGSCGNVAVAEELAHDALVAALEQWPERGVPDRPGAWLMTTAKNRAVNVVRHARLARDKHVADNLRQRERLRKRARACGRSRTA